MLDQDAATRRGDYAVHLVALLGGRTSSPPPPVVHPVIESATVTVGRPGNGGRKRRPVRNTVEGVLNELDARYGSGRELRKSNHILRYFEIDADGDGALMARLSGNDISAGETVAVQLDVQHEMAARHGLRPRWIIVELNADRNIAYEQRMGFALVRDLVAMEGLGWVSWREIDRIARDQLTNMTFCRWLREKERRLYLATDADPLVDWKSPRLDHAFRRLLAEWEADKIVERTSNGLRRRFLETGRGWPGLLMFGFHRGAQDYLVVDDEQWAIVERIYELYLSQHPDGRPFSMRDVTSHLRAEGSDITYYVVQRVLTDRVYVTGRLRVTYRGIDYDVRPIQLRRPIAEELYARAQAQRSGRGGKNSVTPYGYFLLNHVLLLHAPCQDERTKGTRNRLSAKLLSDRPTSWETQYYAHIVSAGGCSTRSWPAPILERAVVEALYRLAADEEVRAAWIANGRGDGQARIEDWSSAEKAAIQERLHRQRHRHADLLARFVADDVAHGDAVDQYSDLAKALLIDIRRLEQQLQRAQRDEPRRPEALDPEALERRLRAELPLVPPVDDPTALRRRVEIIRACVSKIVVHDDPDGRVTLEIFGPLIAPTAPLVTCLPGDGPGSEELIGKTLLADQFLHAWRSPLLPVGWRAVRLWTATTLAADIRRVHACAPPGVMFSSRHPRSCVWSVHRVPRDEPCLSTVLRICAIHGCTPTQMLRAALLPREIVEGRRAERINAGEWLEALAIAFEGGFVPRRRDWRSAWDRHFWPDVACLTGFAETNGLKPTEVVALAYACWRGESDAWKDRIRSTSRRFDRVEIPMITNRHGVGEEP